MLVSGILVLVLIVAILVRQGLARVYLRAGLESFEAADLVTATAERLKRVPSWLPVVFLILHLSSAFLLVYLVMAALHYVLPHFLAGADIPVFVLIHSICTLVLILYAVWPKDWTSTLTRLWQQAPAISMKIWVKQSLLSIAPAVAFALLLWQLDTFSWACFRLWQNDPALFATLNNTPLPSTTHIGVFRSFAFDNIIRVLMFDAPETYGIHISDVKHTPYFWLSTLIFLYKLSLSLSLIRLCLSLCKKIIVRQSYHIAKMLGVAESTK